MTSLAVDVEGLNFDYGGDKILTNLKLQLPRGCRCLLIGANGAGKTTLLRILAGKRLVKGKVMVLGRDAYRDTPQSITYLGPEWAANPVVRTDVSVTSLLNSVVTIETEEEKRRLNQLLYILDVDTEWHMHQVSDGERRRVQILLGLVQRFDMLLLDEVTVDLDVVVRRNLLNFLKDESEQKGASVVYATHIFDGLGNWPTHIAHIRGGEIVGVYKFEDLLQKHASETANSAQGSAVMLYDSPLLIIVEKWLREDFQTVKKNVKGKKKTLWDRLSEDMKTHGDKYYDYWTQ
ncbi:hypothetical protein MP638_006880 [Amoeboaphelidium occidentale]|nr:hypothetical protein MP638_006880 [Amoeboaphelidium occidentale]